MGLPPNEVTTIVVLIIVFFAVRMLIGYLASRRVNNTSDYIVAGRRLPIYLTGASIMATWFAPALVFFHDMKPLDAMKASFAAGAKNWLAMTIFGVFLVVVLFFAMLPLSLGLLLLLPVFSGAVYASYRDIFVGS